MKVSEEETNPLHQRIQSSFPVSIGTGLSLETLFNPILDVYDKGRPKPPRAHLPEYTLFVFNVSTLVRNLLSSIPYASLRDINVKDILSVLLDEIDFITNFFNSNNLPIKFFINDYSYAKNAYPDNLRHITTDKQLYLDKVTTYCLNKVRKEDDVDKFSKHLKYGREEKILLFTHVPWDLLSYKNFTSLSLLESHTGIIKTRKSWNSKYYPIPNKDMSTFPFTEKLLMVFGDKLMVKPDSVKERITLHDKLIKGKVHPLISELSVSMIVTGATAY